MGFRSFGHKNPHPEPVVCLVSFRQCPICQRIFQARPKDRRKFCKDECTAVAVVRRGDGRCTTIQQALDHMRRQRDYRAQKRSYHNEVVRQVVPVTLPPPVKSPMRYRHVPGSIAFMLLYGGGKPFSRGDGSSFVKRGGRSTRAIQRGGPEA